MQNNKPFVNLSALYRKFIAYINDTIVSEKDKIGIESEKISFSQINSIYQKINTYMEKEGIHDYDVNNLLTNYKPKNPNPQVDLIRKLIYLRNINLIKKAIKSKYWKSNIDSLKDFCNDKMTITNNFDQVENAFIHVLKKYMFNWLGCWTMIESNERGIIKGINVFDFKDYDDILIYLGSKNKWKFKDAKEKKRLQKIKSIYKKK